MKNREKKLAADQFFSSLLVVASPQDNNIYVLLGNGDGTFQPPIPYAAGLTPDSPVIADFNNDGIPDVAVANTTPTYNGIARNLETVSIMIGNGDGSFGPPNSTQVEYNLGVLAVGVFTGSGAPNILVGGQSYYSQSTVHLLTMNGDGTVGNVQPLPFLNGMQLPVNIVAADFNKDEYEDFAITTDAGVNLYINNANQFFQGSSVVDSTAYPYAQVVDLNKDGTPDLVLATEYTITSDGVKVLLGKGDGTFETAVTYWTGFAPSSVTALDVNQDGIPDILVSESNSIVGLYAGNGDGTLQAPINYSTGGVYSAAVGDFNGDGNLDISTTYGQYPTFLGNGEGSLQELLVPAGAGGGVAADFNGDGILDLAVPGYAVVLGNGDGTFRYWGQQLPQGYCFNNSCIGTGDFNNDGNVDLAIVQFDYTGTLSIFLGNGDGTFRGPFNYTADAGSLTLAIADFNSDGILDVVVSNQNSDDVSVFLGKGDGTFLPASNYAAGSEPECVFAGDFNHDGRTDLVVCSNFSSLQFLAGNGDGAFQPPAGFGPTGGSQQAKAADVNGDGNLDILVQTPAGMSILYGNSNGTYTTQQDYPISQGFTAADVNNDGAFDLVLTAEATLSVLLNPGGTRINMASSLNPSVVSQQVTIAVGVTASIVEAAGHVPSGSVTCKDGSSVLAMIPLDSQGNAGFSTSSLAVGTHQISCFYSGDTYFNPHQGKALVQVVNQATTTTGVISSPNPSKFNQAVVLTAQVISQIKSVIPTGTVHFFDGNTIIGNSILSSGGTASLTTSALSIGSHPVTASYSGDTNFAGSTSSVVNQVVQGAAVYLSTIKITFGNQTVGISSDPQPVTLTNTGNITLTISSIGITGTNLADFAQTNNCGSSVTAGSSCTISVTFTPSATGARSANVTIKTNAAKGTATIFLSGTGVQPSVLLSPTSLTFPTQVVFTTSKGQTVTLTNTGLGVLNISKIAVTGPFKQTNTCGPTVAAGASCTFTVTFRPTTIGTLTGAISITDNATGSPQKIALTGFGTYIQLSPTSLNFGNQPVGTKSLAKKITLSNKGSVAVSITSISITGTNAGDFAQTNTCGTSVAAGASCFISVTFKPLATGNRSAAVSVSDNGGGSPQKVSLAGTGT